MSTSFEFADSNFTLISAPYMLYDGYIDALTVYPIVLYIRPKQGVALDGDTAQLTASFTANVTMTTLQDTAKVTATATPIVNLRIFHGQSDRGNSWRPPVAESEETTPGAFTVANKNDTDGDGVPDYVDPAVAKGSITLTAPLAVGSAFIPMPASMPNPWHGKITAGVSTHHQLAAIMKAGATTISEVVEIDSYDGANQRLVLRPGTATQKVYGAGDLVFLQGRDEVDLMPLLLYQPRAMAMGDTVKLEYLGTASIKVWTTRQKFGNVVTLPKAYAAADFPAADGYIYLYVEATDVSAALRDIEFKLTYNKNGINVASDTVKATAVWATMTKALHDKSEVYTIWPDFSGPAKMIIDSHGGKIGLLPVDGNGVTNMIIMQYTVYPPQIGAESKVKFDFARRAHYKFWTKEPTKPVVSAGATFPLLAEEANDDPQDDSESASPTTSNHIYDVDGPGLTNPFIMKHEWVVMRFNFENYVRVAFHGTKPAGSTLTGSCCSEYFKWHARHKLIPNGSVWKRSTGDDPESNENDVGAGHITIGDNP